MPRERDLREELEDYDCCEAEGAAGFVEKALAILGEQPTVSRDVLSDVASALTSHLCDEEPSRQLVAAGLGQLLHLYVGGWRCNANRGRKGARQQEPVLQWQPAPSTQRPAPSAQHPAPAARPAAGPAALPAPQAARAAHRLLL